SRLGVRAHERLRRDQAQPAAGEPGRLEALLGALALDRRAVGRAEHLVPALELPEVEAAAARARAVAHDAQPPGPEAAHELPVEVLEHASEVRDRGLAAALGGRHEAAEEEVPRRLLHEAHLAVLWDRVVARELARGEDVRRERAARRGPEVLAAERG